MYFNLLGTEIAVQQK